MKTYEFDEFYISAESRRLARSSGEIVALTPRVFDLLLALVKSDGRVLTKDELLETIWEDCIVEEANLTQSVFVLRKALGESSQNRQFIRTIPSQGYRFICEVKVNDLPTLDQIKTEANAESPIVLFENNGTTPVFQALNDKRPAGIKSYVFYGLILIVAVAFVMGIGYLVVRNRLSSRPAPIYQQLTFERGTVWAARFIPNANAVVYNANLNGGALDLFSLHLPTPEARGMNLANTSLLSISSKGEMAILLNQTYVYQFIHRGILARMPVGGTAYRKVAENVQEADWSPDGENLAAIKRQPARISHW